MKILYYVFGIIFPVFFLFTTVSAQVGEINSDKIKIRGVAELGYVAVLSHKVQFSNSGTYINYVKDGGQDNLYAVSRLSLELDLNRKNTVILLYQPLKIESQQLLRRDLIIDDLVFPEGTGVNFEYGFPFYRISYLREFLSNNETFSFGFGASIQIRNATISFESLDGSLFRRNSDIGIVPLLKFRTRANITDKLYAEIEADGAYAPISYLNGSDNEVVGALLDGSARVGYNVMKPVDAFLNLRYLGGGAVGTDDDFTGPGDGYVRNWLHFLTVTCGFVYSF